MFCNEHSPPDVVELYSLTTQRHRCQVGDCEREAYWITPHLQYKDTLESTGAYPPIEQPCLDTTEGNPMACR